jgi:hypothetical protein
MSNLARKLRLADYFALAFGAMVGVGWLVLIEDWPDAATLAARLLE